MKSTRGNWVSYKVEFIEALETGILTGRFTRGERLPTERELAVMFKVSRPVVHDALKTLEHRGLVTIKPRKGVFVNDYRRQGSIEMLVSIMRHTKGLLSEELRGGLLEFREGFERKITMMALRRATPEQLAAIRACVERMSAIKSPSLAEKLKADFDLHLEIAVATGNPVAAMIFNSFRHSYEMMSAQLYALPGLWEEIVATRRKVVDAIERRDEKAADAAMDRFVAAGDRAIMKTVKDANVGRSGMPKRGGKSGAKSVVAKTPASKTAKPAACRRTGR